MTVMDARPTRGPAAGEVRSIEPLWLLRVNPLRRARLSDATLRDMLAGLMDAEHAVRAAAARCSDELYPLIGAATDDAERKRLVEARRAVNRGRPPKGELPDVPSVASWAAA